LTDALIAINPEEKVAVFTAHNANDDAETKLFQFLRGRKEQPGIPTTRKLNETSSVLLVRPLLNFSRKDLERYARCFALTWCEDASNATDDYTRNKLRHHLIPWVETHVNPGFVNMLNKLRRRNEYT
jgi:tRNA(Ile)-lysidine synthase